MRQIVPKGVKFEMGSIALFPWLTLADNPLHYGGWSLATYRRGKEPFSQDLEQQNVCDQVINGYGDATGATVGRCTVILKDENLWQIGNDEATELLEFSELLAFTALAEREFFHWDYFNRDNFRLIVRYYTDPGKGTAIQLARRDGATLNGFGEGYQQRRSLHIPEVNKVRVDQQLLETLSVARRQQLRGDLWEGILSFNLANTDNPDTPPEVELIHLVSAFQRLFGIGSNCNDLIEHVNAVLPRQWHEVWPCHRSERSETFRKLGGKAANIRSAWLTEFCALRGHVAHGRRSDAFPGAWSIREHLLLGTYLFPRVVRFAVRHQGQGGVTFEDLWEARLFGALACGYHFDSDADEYNGSEPTHPWRSMWRAGSRRAAQRKLRRALGAIWRKGHSDGEQSNA